MHKDSDIPLVDKNTLLSEALIEITNKGLGITLVEDKSKIIGIFTDGDLRRCLNQKLDINTTKIKDVMTKKFRTIEGSALAIDAAEVMEKNKIFTLVVMKGSKNIGVLSMHDLIQARIL
jgi:arabinose-5-phosphate isomerase